MNEFLALAIAQIFKVPLDMVEIAPAWWMGELTALLERADVQGNLRDWIERNQWREKRQWYGEEEK